MEKWASKWRSQIHRFYKKFPGEAPGPTYERGVLLPSRALPLPPPGNKISGSGPELEYTSSSGLLTQLESCVSKFSSLVRARDY